MSNRPPRIPGGGFPVPSVNALRVLRRLALLSSGAIAGVGTLMLEEQRRRICLARRIIDSHKRIRERSRHSNSAAALHNVDLNAIEDLFWKSPPRRNDDLPSRVEENYQNLTHLEVDHASTERKEKRNGQRVQQEAAEVTSKSTRPRARRRVQDLDLRDRQDIRQYLSGNTKVYRDFFPQRAKRYDRGIASGDPSNIQDGSSGKTNVLQELHAQRTHEKHENTMEMPSMVQREDSLRNHNMLSEIIAATSAEISDSSLGTVRLEQEADELPRSLPFRRRSLQVESPVAAIQEAQHDLYVVSKELLRIAGRCNDAATAIQILERLIPMTQSEADQSTFAALVDQTATELLQHKTAESLWTFVAGMVEKLGVMPKHDLIGRVLSNCVKDGDLQRMRLHVRWLRSQGISVDLTIKDVAEMFRHLSMKPNAQTGLLLAMTQTLSRRWPHLVSQDLVGVVQAALSRSLRKDLPHNNPDAPNIWEERISELRSIARGSRPRSMSDSCLPTHRARDDAWRLEMWLLDLMSAKEYRQAVNAYWTAFSRSALPPSLRALEIAVQSSIKANHNETKEALGLVQAAVSRGLDASKATLPIVMARMQTTERCQPASVKSILIDISKAVSKDSTVNNMILTQTATRLLNEDYATAAVELLDDVCLQKWAIDIKPNIALMTVWLRASCRALRFDRVLQIARTVLDKGLDIDWRFSRALRNACTFLNHEINTASTSASTVEHLTYVLRQLANIRSLLQEQRLKKIDDIENLGWDLLEIITFMVATHVHEEPVSAFHHWENKTEPVLLSESTSERLVPFEPSSISKKQGRVNVSEFSDIPSPLVDHVNRQPKVAFQIRHPSNDESPPFRNLHPSQRHAVGTITC